MRVLIDEDKRAIGIGPDDGDWTYPDERWEIISGLPDDAEVLQGEHDMIHYRWDGEKFIYDPKIYEEE